MEAAHLAGNFTLKMEGALRSRTKRCASTQVEQYKAQLSPPRHREACVPTALSPIHRALTSSALPRVNRPVLQADLGEYGDTGLSATAAAGSQSHMAANLHGWLPENNSIICTAFAIEFAAHDRLTGRFLDSVAGRDIGLRCGNHVLRGLHSCHRCRPGAARRLATAMTDIPSQMPSFGPVPSRCFYGCLVWLLH
jgi:hypothetical protein